MHPLCEGIVSSRDSRTGNRLLYYHPGPGHDQFVVAAYALDVLWGDAL